MRYIDRLFTEENIKAFENFENSYKDSLEDIDYATGSDIFQNLVDFENADRVFSMESKKSEKFHDDDYDRESERVERMMNYKSRQIVNASRGLQVEQTMWKALFPKYSSIADANRQNILKFVFEYIKRNIEMLSSRGPSRRVIWSKTDTFNFFAATGFLESDINDAIKKSDYIKSNWEIGTNPLNILMSVLSSYFWQNRTDKEKKNENYKANIVFVVNLIFTIRFYSSLYQKYFKYDPDEEMMNTIVEELSGRYNLKAVNNIYELLEFIAYTNINNTIDIMNNPTDYNIYYFITNLNGRINSMLKEISNKYYERYEENKKTTVDKMTGTNKEGDEYLNETNSISNDITNIVRKMLIKLSGESSVDEKILEIACKQTKVSTSKMRVSIDEMRSKDKETIGNLISLILSYYLGTLKKKKSTIRSISFISIMKKVYSVSNTNSEIIIKIKEVLDILLKKHSKEYLNTNRAATLSNLKITCYLYWILYINSRCE